MSGNREIEDYHGIGGD